GREIELHQRIDRLWRRIDDVEQALVGSHFELLAALLVDVRRAVDRELLDLGRQRDRTTHLRAGALRRRHDLAGRRIENAVIEGLEPDSDILTVHGFSADGLQLLTTTDRPVIAASSDLPPSLLRALSTLFAACFPSAYAYLLGILGLDFLSHRIRHLL